MPFYYVQDVYHKNHLGTIDKRANIISGKASVARFNRVGGSEPLSRGLGGGALLRTFLGTKEHLDWLKINLNAVEIRFVQDYICTKN